MQGEKFIRKHTDFLPDVKIGIRTNIKSSDMTITETIIDWR